MKVYTFHSPLAAGEDLSPGLEKARLLKDGFVWCAFLFSFFWFFFHRLWLAGLGVLLAAIALNVTLAYLGLPPWNVAIAQLLFSLLVGLEANSLRRWTYARRGMAMSDVVNARNLEEAELKAFSRSTWQVVDFSAKSAGVTVQGKPLPPSQSEAIIGLFPEAERKS